ncbi:MAG: thiamine phosphate synthase [Gammaproteobacteria bacterium]|nr:thiamine phosphate synthase [Gammaproteobacteria bacterium]
MSGLYGIADASFAEPVRLVGMVKRAIKGGVALIQYRNKVGDTDLVAAQLARVCKETGTLFIVNDDIELARQVGADGVHLGQQDASIAEARRALGPQAIVGRTCHDSIALARAAAGGGASYVAFGRFFPSGTKPMASAAPLSILRQAREITALPLVAIGGITQDNGALVLDAGADALAVGGALFGSPDIEAAARGFCALFPNQEN